MPLTAVASGWPSAGIAIALTTASAILVSAFLLWRLRRGMSVAAIFRHPALLAVALCLIILHIVCIPAWLKSQRRFLCATQWAKEQGVSSDRLRLFALGV